MKTISIHFVFTYHGICHCEAHFVLEIAKNITGVFKLSLRSLLSNSKSLDDIQQ